MAVLLLSTTRRVSTLGRAIDVVIGDGNLLTGGITVALAGVGHGGLIATMLPPSPGENPSSCRGAEWRPSSCKIRYVMPPSAAEAFAQLYGLTGSELRGARRHGARAWREGSG